MSARVTSFFDPATWTFSYVVADPDTSKCAIVDSVLDFDPASGRTSTSSAGKIVDFIQSKGLDVEWILETHVHADHFTAAQYLRQTLGGRLAIGSGIRIVQETFAKLYNLGSQFPCDGSQFDVLFDDSSAFKLGGIDCQAWHTPGHTPACMTYVIGDAAFVGDTLFMPDYGTARADFPGGDAATLYQSIQKLYALPPETRLYLCHDYGSESRDEYCGLTTVQEERESNIHVTSSVSEKEFVALRNARDKQLDVPRLLLPSIQVNMRAGAMPTPENNGIAYLKIPIDVL